MLKLATVAVADYGLWDAGRGSRVAGRGLFVPRVVCAPGRGYHGIRNALKICLYFLKIRQLLSASLLKTSLRSDPFS